MKYEKFGWWSVALIALLFTVWGHVPFVHNEMAHVLWRLIWAVILVLSAIKQEKRGW